MLRSAATLALLSLVAASARADEPWKVYARESGVTFEKRAVSGSHFDEYRAQATLPSPPAQVAEAIWRGITEAVPKTVKKRTVLRHSDSEYLVYDELDPPVVKDRDVTIQIHKVALSGGALQIAFHSAPELGPPPSERYVRIPMVRGAWTLRPAPGGTALVYECYSEPGGSVPAFLVRGIQEDQVRKDVARMLAGLHLTH